MSSMKSLGTLIFAGCVAGMTLAEAAPAAAQTASYLDQGWTTSDRGFFYATSQGSRLMPYRILVNLEQAGSTQRFLGYTNLTAMGFLFDGPSTSNPDNLPVGLVKDTDLLKGDAIGFTCAACHTREIKVTSASGGTTRFRIDGGQADVDIERFLAELESALSATYGTPDKLTRLYAAVGATTTAAKDKIKSSVLATYLALQEERLSTVPSGMSQNRPGPGRLDALGHIKNHVANLVYPKNYASPSNTTNANAPASIPYLWDSPFQTHTQWSGTVTNKGLGSLGRNLGEVTGAFAETNVNRTLGVFTAGSSAKITNLVDLENKVIKLKSPQWPSAFSPIDQARVSQGATLYQQNCVSCHGVLDRNPRSQYITVYAYGADYVGTDPTQADNNTGDALTNPQGAVVRSVNPDVALAGLTKGSVGSTGYNTPVNPMGILSSVLAPQLAVELARIPFLDASHKQSGAPSDPPGERLPGEPAGHTYKARPLNGIWATGPYLHNGSVRTLYELLLPPAQRASTFCVGSPELDFQNVGMKNDCAVPGAHILDTNQVGNRATGHTYGTALTDTQRRALVEYMKTL
jgi:mono/diheme cytochrome c family protein